MAVALEALHMGLQVAVLDRHIRVEAPVEVAGMESPVLLENLLVIRQVFHQEVTGMENRVLTIILAA